MPNNRFRINTSRRTSAAGSPSTELNQASSHRFRLSQTELAPTVVDTNPASPVPSGIPMSGATRSLSILIEDSDSEPSITSPSLNSNQETSSPVGFTSPQPEDILDRSIPVRRTLLPNEVNFPVYSTTRTARFPLLPIVQANVADYDTACRYLLTEGVLYDSTYQGVLCPNGGVMSLRYNRNRGIVWRCGRHNCCNKSRESVLIGSFFSWRKTSLSRQFLILYLWLAKAPRETISLITGTHPQTIRELVLDFYQVMQNDIGDHDIKIGGEGVIVEIDESKFGKRKYNHGHPVEGVWVVGGVERTAERRCFMMTVPNRNSETMKNIITNHVLPGSIIHTDYWRAYNGIVEWEMGYGHRAVNHEEGYVNEEGTHTNTIEGTWNGIKIRCFPRTRTKKNMPWVLLEFIWRRKYYGDLFGGMMKSLREVNFVPGDRANSAFTEYGSVETDVEDDLSDYSSSTDENDDDGSDDDYRPYPPSNSTTRIIIDQEIGVSNIGQDDITGDISRNTNNENISQRRRLNDEVILPFGVIRRSRRIRITNMSLS